MLQSMALQEEAFGSFDGLPERVPGVDYAKVSRVLSTPLTCYANSNADIEFKQEIQQDHEVDASKDLPREPLLPASPQRESSPPQPDITQAASLPSPPPPSPETPHIDPEDIFEDNLVHVDRKDGNEQLGFVSKELILASIAFLLLFLLGCAKWNRRIRRRRPASGERLPILAESRTAGVR